MADTPLIITYIYQITLYFSSLFSSYTQFNYFITTTLLVSRRTPPPLIDDQPQQSRSRTSLQQNVQRTHHLRLGINHHWDPTNYVSQTKCDQHSRSQPPLRWAALNHPLFSINDPWIRRHEQKGRPLCAGYHHSLGVFWKSWASARRNGRNARRWCITRPTSYLRW